MNPAETGGAAGGFLSDPIGWLVSGCMALLGLAWRQQDKRIDALEIKLETKASNDEVTRQRDNVGELFERVEEVKDEVNRTVSGMKDDASRRHLDIVERINASESRIMLAIRRSGEERQP